MDKKNLTILVISAVVIFVLGGGMGILYQAQKNGAPIQNHEQTIKALMSKVVPSIVAFGEVAAINGKNVSLNYSGDNLTIKVRDDALIYTLIGTDQSAQQQVAFSAIKKGDNLSINMRVNPQGQLEGMSVIIMPQSISGK